jgi:N6-adenosine-specific RNA methylase IME4
MKARRWLKSLPAQVRRSARFTAFSRTGVHALSIRALADDLTALIFEQFTRPALMKLLEVGQDWSVKREEFRSALLRRTAKTLMIHTPNLSKKSEGGSNAPGIVRLRVWHC